MDDCLVQLSSKSHHGNILGALHQMRLGGELIDITVHVDHQGEVEEFQAHQVMLAANSGYFKRLLLSQEAVPDKLFLSNMIRTTYFSTFLEFVYTGKVEVARDKIVDVQAVADLLDCKDLLEVCGTAMSSCFTKEPEAEECSPVHGSERAAEEGPGSSAKKWLKQALKRKSPLKSANRGRPKKLKKVSDTAKEKDVSPEDGGIRRVSIRLAGRKIPVGVLKMRDSAEEDSDNPGPDSTDPDNPDPDSTSEMEDGEAAANPAAPTENPADNEEEFQKAQRVSNIDSGRDDDDDDDDDNNNDDDKEDHGEGEENTVEDGLDDLPYQREEEEGREESERSSKRTSKAQFQCESCQRTFHYERSYLKHISTYHGVKAEVTYRCETCQQTFANRGNLKIHEKHVHSDERLFSCQVCTKTFKRKKDVIRHQRQVHEGGAQRHICPECGKTLSSKTALSLHERTHTGAKPFECTVCASRFTQSSALKMHQRTHTGEKPFACDLCEAKFTQKHMLAYHKRSHTGEKPFMCESCGKSFASKEYLRHHSNIHTGSRPYKCKQCGRGFAQRNSLHQHLKIHTGERPYSCKDCTKQFTQLNALQRHQRIHTGEKPYMCGLCNRTFTDKSTVRRHTMTHDTDAPWKNYLVVLEGNVDDKKSKPSPGGKAERSAAGEDRATAGVGDTVNSEGATVQTQAEAIVVPAQPVTLPADWASHGTIALVSHGSLGGITVIHTEVPHGTQIQPIVTTDATGASVISLDGSSITVPFALPISMAHTIPVSTVASASSLALPVSLDVPVSEVATASAPAASTASVLEAAASQTILATASGAAAGEADIQEVVLCEKHYNTDADTVPGDELQKAAEDMSSEEVEEASTEQTV